MNPPPEKAEFGSNWLLENIFEANKSRFGEREKEVEKRSK